LLDRINITDFEKSPNGSIIGDSRFHHSHLESEHQESLNHSLKSTQKANKYVGCPTHAWASRSSHGLRQFRQYRLGAEAGWNEMAEAKTEPSDYVNFQTLFSRQLNVTARGVESEIKWTRNQLSCISPERVSRGSPSSNHGSKVGSGGIITTALIHVGDSTSRIMVQYRHAGPVLILQGVKKVPGPLLSPQPRCFWIIR
jgi:hypothetical protein